MKNKDFAPLEANEMKQTRGGYNLDFGRGNDFTRDRPAATEDRHKNDNRPTKCSLAQGYAACVDAFKRSGGGWGFGYRLRNEIRKEKIKSCKELREKKPRWIVRMMHHCDNE